MKNTVIYRQYREKIFRHILRLVRRPADAEDLTQEVFLRAWSHCTALQDPTAVTAWLYRIATNLCYDHLKKSEHKYLSKTVVTDVNEIEIGPNDPLGRETETLKLDQLLEQSEMSACIHDFIRNLPEDYRLVILLHDLWGLSGPEIVFILNCSHETVKIRLHRARRKLKAALSAGCYFSHDERGVFVCDRKAAPRLRQIQPEPL